MSYEVLLYEKRGHVAYITLNRPHALNALNTQLFREIDLAFVEYQRDGDAWIAVLRGAGERAFCAGADLKEMAEGKFSVRPPGLPVPSFFFGTLPLVKPVIGAIHGYAMGGGFELSLACDILVASEDAQFALSEVLQGINPGPGIHLIMRKLPYNIALEYLMTGSRLSATEAHRFGLVNRVVPRDQLDAAVEEMVGRLLAAAPLAIRAVKESALRGLGAPIATTLAMSTPSWIGTTQDAKEGPRAFAEKRKPNWQGK
jgi:enoyl-CoA hydratase/carnithine racemase